MLGHAGRTRDQSPWPFAFVGVTALGEELLPRVEYGFLAGSVAAAVVMGVSVRTMLSKGLAGTHDADELVEASHQLPIEP